MNLYTTQIRAIDPKDGILKTWGGPYVPGISIEDAKAYCERNELNYCKVDGILVSLIPTKDDEQTPDWSKMKNYDNIYQWN